jgi:hypothetical protein
VGIVQWNAQIAGNARGERLVRTAAEKADFLGRDRGLSHAAFLTWELFDSIFLSYPDLTGIER